MAFGRSNGHERTQAAVCPLSRQSARKRQWKDVAAMGQMKRVERTFIPHSGIQREAEVSSWSGTVI